jgi:hypothetical protein
MRNWYKLSVFILAVTLIFGLFTDRVCAAEKSVYTYQITFYAGNIGSFQDIEGLEVSNKDAVVTVTENKLIVSGLNLGDTVAFNAQANIKLDETDKHYVQGVRLSGYDNDTVAASVFEVERDRDYVVAYGIKGNMTSYTIQYQDPYGNVLAPDEVYYGNVGDKPVIPYLYVDGYEPRYMGLTKTLSANAAENLFIFVYDKIQEDIVVVVPGEGGDNTDSEVQVNVNTGSTTGAGGNAGPTEPAGTTGTTDIGTNPGTEADVETPGDNEEESLINGSDNNENQDEQEIEEDSFIVDLDDEEIPLANLDENIKDKEYESKMFTSIALIMVGLGLLTFILMLLLKKKTKENED